MTDGLLELLKELEYLEPSLEIMSLKSNKEIYFCKMLKLLVFMCFVILPLNVGLNEGCYFNVSF